jgi:hypothetical protein
MPNKLIFGLGMLIIGALTFGDNINEALRGNRGPGSGKRGNRATGAAGDGGELDNADEKTARSNSGTRKPRAAKTAKAKPAGDAAGRAKPPPKTTKAPRESAVEKENGENGET